MSGRQPVVLGINEKGELIWGNIEMPLWQRKMFPIRYTGDFMAFWQKLNLMQAKDFDAQGGCNADFRSHVPSAKLEKKYQHKRQGHKGD